MDGTVLQEVEELKLLGVTFDKEVCVKHHVLHKAAIAGKLVGMLRRQRMFLSERARNRIYVSTIRPIMEYGSPVFSNAPTTALAALDAVQKKAQILFPSYKLDPLSLRRDVGCLSILYNIISGNSPVSVCQAIAPKFQQFNRLTRLAENVNLRALVIPQSRTENHKRSFMPTYTRLWNNLPTEIVFSDSLQDFKRSVCRQLRNCLTPQ